MKRPLTVTATLVVLSLLAAAVVACGGGPQGAAGSPEVVTTPPAVLPAAGIILKVPGDGSFTLVPPTAAERSQVKLANPDDVKAALRLTLPMTPTAFLSHVRSSEGLRGFAGRTVWVLCYDRQTPVPWVAGGPPRSGSPQPTHTMLFTKNVYVVDANHPSTALGYMLP